jgi:photosystem II stability/assembly factor-like uncharacterized protein
MKSNARVTAAAAALLAACTGGTAAAQEGDFVQREVLAKMRWRSVGPVNFGGRVVDIDVDPRRPATYYVATATGGLFKTTNHGTSFESIFDSHPAVSLGDIAVAPSQPDVLYLGTGEANNQRSAYWGRGVYKSTDAGKTWQHVGLEGTEHIGRVAVHPTDPSVAFAAALGALYRGSDERGLYRTADGGATWQRVAHVSADVGFVDVVVDPSDPSRVYAASYERRRRAHHIDEGGPGSAVWKSTDGGATFEKLGGGLPSGEIGRIGLALFPGNPLVLYATVENRNPATAAVRASTADSNEGRDRGVDGEPPPSAVAQDPRPRLIGGEVYRTDDGGLSWRKTNDRPIGGRPGYYYGQIRVDPQDDQIVYVLSVGVNVSSDGGKTWRSDFGRGLHPDHHALWIDPANPRHILLGNDGGLAVTWDRSRTWDYLNDLSLGQFYAIAVDDREPYRIYGGTQDNGTWAIPSRSLTMRGLAKADAVKVNGGDGFYVCVDPTDPDVVYSESQFGSLSRFDLRTGERAGIRPGRERGSPPLRFNWMSPVVLSPHNPHTLYFGSQHVHRSRNRGDHWETISPDLTTNDTEKLKGNVPHCTITSLAESPRAAELLWVGTDDGKVWRTRKGGRRWDDLTDRFEGVPAGLWVSRVEASPADADRAYVAFTGYREGRRAPHLFMTTDGGETFRSIANDLPQASINVVREHPRNPDALFVGTELGVHASVDAGATWRALGNGLPATPVHDLLVHPRHGDLVIGTHGRGLFVLDIAPLEQLNSDVLASAFWVFPPRDGRILPRGFGQGYTGARGWTGANPELGASISYYLGQDSDAAVTVSVEDAAGESLFEREGERAAGLHHVTWNPRGGGREARGGEQRSTGPGQYVFRVKRGETELKRPFWIHGSPDMGALFFAGEADI